jgi:hypothetical protein
MSEELKKPVYTEAICGNAVAILKDGEILKIDQIVSELNRSLESSLQEENKRLRELLEELLNGGQFFSSAIEQHDPHMDFEEWEVRAEEALETSKE